MRGSFAHGVLALVMGRSWCAIHLACMFSGEGELKNILKYCLLESLGSCGNKSGLCSGFCWSSARRRARCCGFVMPCNWCDNVLIMRDVSGRRMLVLVTRRS